MSVKKIARHITRTARISVYAAALAGMLLYSVVPLKYVNAGSTPYDFSTPASYTVGDATKAEVASNTARLKNQQYATDDNTAAYWRFDETSGNTGDDQSANANDVSFSTTTPCTGATWGAGKIAADGIDVATYGATALGGLAGCASVADSPSLSLSSQVTLEAYLKFSGAFDQTNTITQGVLDKGNYRLYFDESDGKLKFELDDDDAKTWGKVGGSALTPVTPGINGNEGINGSWRQFVPSTVYTLVEFSGSLYIGTVGNGTNYGTGEVWKYSGSNQTWTKVGGDGNGTTNWDTTQTEAVYSLAVHDSALYAGLGLTAGDGEIWRYSGSGTTWTKVAGGGVGSSWTAANNIEAVYSMVSDGTYLYAGTGNTATSTTQSDGDVWRCASCSTSPSWTIIGGTNNTTGATVNSSWGYTATTGAYEVVWSMVIMNGTLYVGLGNTVGAGSYADAEVWRWNSGSSNWTLVGGDAVNSSWAVNTSELVFSLATDGTYLYAGLGSSASDADVWVCADCGDVMPVWSQIGGDSASNWNTGFSVVRGLTHVNGTLYASLGDTAGQAEVWAYSGAGVIWTRIGGDGTGLAGKKSWDAVFLSPESTSNVKEQAFLGTFNSKLVVGTGNTPQDAEVWQCDATCTTASAEWSQLGGQDFRSWGGANLSYVSSMAVNAGKLYTGTGSTNKHATIWEYNGTTWSQVGGGNLNLPDGENWNNYEYVLSMASYKGDLYAGFGTTADDADVWKYSGGTWTQVGGTTRAGVTVNNSWTDANNIEEVDSMTADDTYLYVGTGVTATDGDVWRFDGSTWGGLPIGGSRNDTNVLVNNSWAAGTFERVQALKVSNGFLFAGLGSSAGDAEVWRWNGTNWGTEVSPNTTRNRIGGDGDATFTTTWNRSDQSEVVRESIRSMTFIDGTMYVALGDTNDAATAADAEVWSCTNCLDSTVYAYAGTKPNWTKVGGDAVNGSWDNLVYEQVTSIVGYKGHLFAALGINNSGSDYDSELWEYNGSTWSKVGGDAQTGDTWGGTYELAGELIVLNGRLYTGLGTTNNTTVAADAEVWEYGANTSKVVASTTALWTAGRWYHVAGTYDGTTAKVFVCDSTNLSACTTTAETSSSFGTMTLADTDTALAIGNLHGALGPDRSYGGFTGTIDEVRISNTARTSFNYSRYTNAAQTVRPTTAISRAQKYSWSAFEATDTLNGGTITYRVSDDNGSSWKYYSGGWTTSASTAQANTEAEVNTNIAALSPTSSGLLWQAVLTGNGDQQVTLNSVTVSYVDDTEAPNNVSSVTGNDGNWFSRTSPSFTWSAPTDPLPDPNPDGEQASGVGGYYVYFGKNADAVPRTDPAATFTASASYTPSGIPSGDTDPYYLRIQTRDLALNTSADDEIYDQFRDTKAPNNVSSVTGNANSGNWFNRLNPVFTWSAPTDDLPSPNTDSEVASGINGYYVYFGTNATAVPRTDGTFQTGTTYTASPIDPSDTQTYYFRIQTKDKALNVSDDGDVYDAFRDTTPPPAVTSVTGNASSGSWFDRANPQFSWTAVTDAVPSPNPTGEKASGVDGYYVYFGTNASADPVSLGTFVTGTSYTASPIAGSDTQTYYFRIKARDRAFNASTVNDTFRDTTAPNNIASVTALSAQGGTAITTDTWYNHTAPYFSWDAPTDDLPDPNTNGEIASGVGGYYVYFGTNSGAVPRTDGTFQTGTSYTASNLTSGYTYYLRIQSRDNALNTTSDSTGVLAAFAYKIDTVGPSGPTAAASPAGYTAVNSFTFFWINSGSGGPIDPGAPTNGSGVPTPPQFKYRVGTGTWSVATTETQIVLDGGDADPTTGPAYQEGANVFEIKAIDNVGNEGTATSVTFYYAGSAPLPPQNLTVTPSTTEATPTTENAFSFSWSPPENPVSPIKQYRFSVNRLPTATNTTITPYTSLAAAPYATQQGKNTFYVVAQDEADNVNYDDPAHVDFYTLTPAPAPPTQNQIFDISNRDTQEYAISMKWTEPTKASGFDGYEVFRSEDNATFVSAGTTRSPVFIDTNLSSKVYYYKVRSKDNAGQYSADSTTVSLTPTGRYTSPPALADGPTVTAKSYSAVIEWFTDRIGSSFIEYGPDQYHLGTEKGGETVGTLDLLAKHTVELKGLEPETTYAYQAVWVDQDGNRGQSDVLSFLTGVRPKISDVKVGHVTLETVDLIWKTTTASSSQISYGTTKAKNMTAQASATETAMNHHMEIDGLQDGTMYYFMIKGTDVDGNYTESDEYVFTTLTRPLVSNVGHEQVKDAATTTFRFSWTTNVPTTTILSYGPSGAAQRTQSSPEYTTDHTATVSGLSELTPYTFQAKGVDEHGNTASGPLETVTTPGDTRAPRLLNMTVEVRSSGVGAAQKAQLVINWETDELSSSQVEYGPGISSDSYPSKTQEDPALSTTHVVIVPELEPAKLYHLRAVSRDSAGNTGTTIDTTAITGKAHQSVIDIIISSLQRSLGFLSFIPTTN